MPQPVAAQQVLVWRNRSIWQPRVRACLADFGFRRLSTRTEGEREAAAAAALADELPTLFVAAEAFHAGRPLAVEAYYREGLVPLSCEAMGAHAWELFRSVRPHLTRGDVAAAMTAVGSGTREGYIYFSLDRRNLLAHAGHYLIYGSEYLMCLAVHLDRSNHGPSTTLLRERGTPTIFRCHLPWGLLSDFEREQVAFSLVREAAVRRAPAAEAPPIDHSIMVRGAVPGDCVVDHMHPLEPIHDWHRDTTYRWRPAPGGVRAPT